ncbi:MAG: ABC transporter substrate-binding protein [Dehalococcoidia bacterium]|nr:ABC transporter substrate-binding protein [Dehalococcoidia bacterium]
MGYDNAEQIWDRPLTRRQLMGAMAAGGASLALVGCGDDDDDSGAAVQESSQPKKGGNLTLTVVTGPAILDPQKSITVANGPADVWGLISTPIVRFDWRKGTIYDGSAEKWEFPDPLTLLIRLKKNTHFHQESMGKGREVEASDVVASLERLRTKGDATFGIASRFNLVDTYEAVDKYTVRVKFTKPDANFLSWMYHPGAGIIFPKEALAKHGGAGMIVPEVWYSNGPFIPDISSYRPDISVSLKRNPNYDVDPGGLPYLDGITVLGIADASTREAAFRSGQTDIGLMSTLSVKNFQSTHQIGSTEDAITAVSQLNFNTTIPPFNDPRVRQAFHRSVDREELKLVVGEGFGCASMLLGCRSALYLTEKDFEGKPGFRKDKKEDIADAKKLLAAAGVDPTKTTLKFGASALTTYKVYADQNASLKGSWERNLGLKIELITPPTGYPLPAQVKAEGHQMIALSNGGLGGLIWDDPLWHATHSTGIHNSSFWFDKKTDELVEKQQQALDINERKKLWAELQRYLFDTSDNSQTMPSSPIVRNYDFFGAKKTVRNWTMPGYFLSHYPWQFNKVWLDQ